MIQVPSCPVCSACGKTIEAGQGRFVASSAGPVPEPEFTFCHSGGLCPGKAGAVEGSGRIWGSISTLLAIVMEGSSVIPCSGGPVYIRARGTEGEVVADFLEMLIVILGAVCVGLALAGGRF